MIPRRRPDAPLQRISRRGLITSGVLAGVLAASGVPVHAQRRGGTLRVALPGAFAGWGIAAQDLLGRVAGAGSVFDTLTEIAASGELVGELAEGWEARDSGALWTFAIRAQARFHDGRPVTAADVVASLARHRDPASPLSWLLAGVTQMDAPAPDRLRIRLAAPDADLPLLLADPHLVIAPGGDIESGIGSGLYRAVQTDGPLHLTRVDRHWKDGRAGWFAAVTLLPVPSPDDALALLATGAADVATGAGPLPGLTPVSVPASASLLLAPPPGLPGLAQALSAPDRAARLMALERDWTPDPPAFTALHSPRLRHDTALGDLAPLDSGRIAERWWFA